MKITHKKKLFSVFSVCAFDNLKEVWYSVDKLVRADENFIM